MSYGFCVLEVLSPLTSSEPNFWCGLSIWWDDPIYDFAEFGENIPLAEVIDWLNESNVNWIMTAEAGERVIFPPYVSYYVVFPDQHDASLFKLRWPDAVAVEVSLT